MILLHTARRHILSPSGLLLRALLMVAVFGVLHACGARNTMAVLCGTDVSAGAARSSTLVLAALYLLAYLGATVLAPIFCLAALLLKLAGRSTQVIEKAPYR